MHDMMNLLCMLVILPPHPPSSPSTSRSSASHQSINITTTTPTNPTTNSTTNLHHRFRSLDLLDIDACDDDIIPYKIDIQTHDRHSPYSFALQNDDKNQALHVTYRPKASITYVNVAVVW
jgi:hypothetical protein